jgi:hypothetical protein
VNPDNNEIANFCAERHLQCIPLNATTVVGNTAGALVINSALVISQLTNAISLQNEEAMGSNNEKKLKVRLSAKRRRKTRPRTCTLPS